MMAKLQPTDSKTILHVVNDSAMAYKGVIPADRWKNPYMSTEELKQEIENGVDFYGWMENNVPVAVMGIQRLNDVTLIRHAYVLTNLQRSGIGTTLLKHLVQMAQTSKVLVGTWEAAHWAVRFYEKHGFRLIPKEEKDVLLRKYWKIPERQIETSIVLELKKQP